MKIGIFGGTFNPVHVEHVNLAKQAVKELGLDKLIVMPTFMPPHKTTEPLSAEHRIKMLEIAFKGVESVEISDFEVQKGGKSYTYQTIEHFKATYDAQLYFLVGADMLKDFKNWRYPERILDCCTLAAFGRQASDYDYAELQEYFYATFGKHFIKLSYTGGLVSSTKARIYASFGLSLKGIVPEAVEKYITNNGLYAGNVYARFVQKALTQKRLIHTANVCALALSKAKELGLNEQKVLTTATLHDCAKYISPESVQGFVLPKGVPSPVVHAFLGAHIAQQELGICDQEIIDAIRYHTSGKAQMSTLGKLIFVADMLEEGRDYQGVDKLRALFSGDIEVCFRECLREELVHLLNKKQPIYKETLMAYDYYVKEK